ncbi:efflux RND transporter periplasmic adaptor subunit [Flindersiella endophytica]
MSRRGRLGAVPAVVGTLLVVAVAGVAAFGFVGPGTSPRDESAGRLPDKPAATAKIVQRTLTKTSSMPGQLDHGTAQPLSSKAAGTVTWLPAVGATVRRGGALLKADEQPILLLYGRIPAFRELRKDIKGNDVLQFERNLRALGYQGFTVDEEYSGYTERAVKRWQTDLGLPETGKVETGRIVYAQGPLRVAEQKVRVGASATGEVLSYTDTTKVVTVDARTVELAWAVKGARVDVTLADGKRLTGTVASVGAEASGQPGEAPAAPTADGPATVPVTIDIANQRALAKLDTAPVDVTYVVSERRNVLAVPVAALLALSEGGYGLEVVSGGTVRLEGVRTGLFADGLVEVSGAGIRAGLTVGMPK